LRVLVVRLSSIGDVVHTLPAAAALRAHGWDAGWLVEPASHPLLDRNPAVSRLALAPPARAFRLGGALGALRALRAHGYDVALDLQGLWKSAAWARLSGAPRVLGFARPWRREPASAALLGETAEVPPEAVHVIDKNLALLRPLGIEAMGARTFPLPETRTEAASVERGLATAGLEAFVVLNAGGGWASKLWPADAFGALARRLLERGLRSVVTWGPGEEDLADRVVATSGGAAVRCFPTTLRELIELLRRARLVVAADTGPLHLACAVGTPVVGIYGPTDPVRNGPFARDDSVVRRTPACAPCHRRRCAVHDGIMGSIGVGEVLTAVEERLASAARGRGVAV
jgi:lipopolysaccharide heptosyltransferase I